MVELRKEGRIGDVLLLLQHTPVITLGRNAKQKNIIASPEALAQRGVEIFECDRGGDVTFHGPGQLVGYPIFDLRGLPSSDSNHKSMGAIEYVRSLEEALIRTCADFKIPTKRICGLTGVWTAPEHVGAAAPGCAGRGRALSLHGYCRGQACRHRRAYFPRVTSHGFALNVNTDLDYFDLIVPCGITAKPVTSMARNWGGSFPCRMWRNPSRGISGSCLRVRCCGWNRWMT